MNASTPLLVLIAAIAGALAGAIGVYLVAFSLKKNSDAEAIQQKEDLKNQFTSLSQNVFNSAMDQFLHLAQSRLETEQVRHKAELDEKRQAVETAVTALSQRLKDYETLMRGFEQDRREKYGSLEEQLRSAVTATQRLQGATDSLQSMLSNSRTRGQWGERMAEDILRGCGLKEGVQYERNKAQDTVSTRPDYTFFLPNDYKFHMDVKFPLDNYMRSANAQTDEDRARFKTEFIRDAKARIKEVTKRDYVNPDEKTLDYVLLFIPNEQVYGFLQEASPGLLDETIAQKVVLCSPFTLYAVLCVIRQSFENFHFAEATEEVVRLVANFRQTYDKFTERFEKLGEQLGKTADLYSEISETSHKRLEQAIAKIDRVRRGQEQESPAALEEPPKV